MSTYYEIADRQIRQIRRDFERSHGLPVGYLDTDSIQMPQSLFDNKAYEKLLEEARAQIEVKPLLANSYVTKVLCDGTNKNNSIIKTGETKMAIFDRNEKKVPEEWVWVEGYKGTDKTLGCRGYQYEMHNVHTMPKGEEIVECRSGFHFCIELKRVFDYYNIENGNRFFRVRAEVKKSDLDKYYEQYKIETNAAYPDSVVIGDPIGKGIGSKDKLAARSIEFLYELTPDDIFKGSKGENWSKEDKLLAMQMGIETVQTAHSVRELVELGYSEPFAWYIKGLGRTEVAKAVASQKDLSMDMKAMLIMREGGRADDSSSYWNASRDLAQAMASSAVSVARAANSMSAFSSIGRRF